MIYIDNESSYSQRIFIPRDEAPTASTTGHTFSLQKKDYEITENGLIRIHPDAGYDGISGGSIGVYVTAATGVTPTHLNVTENGIYVPTGDTVYTGVTVEVSEEEAYNQGFEDGYASGYTVGYGDGYSSGQTDGYQEGYTSGSTDGYASGRTDGYASGSTDGFNSGYTSGCTDGYSSGRTDGFNAGYASGMTDGYASGYTDGYASGSTDGFASGVTYQKSLLTSETFTRNGIYTREDGWNSVTVEYPVFSIGFSGIEHNGHFTYDFQQMMGFEGAWNNISFDVAVPQTGGTGVLGSLTADQNNTTYYPPQGVDGYSAVTVSIDESQVYQDGYNAGYSSGYTSGSTDGFGSGYTSGVTYQRSLLSAETFTLNGTYTRPDGLSSVTVSVVNEYSVLSATAVTKTANQSVSLYYPFSLYGKTNNVKRVRIEQTGEDVTASTYVFATPGVYTLVYYTTEIAPVLKIEDSAFTSVNIMTDSIDYLSIASPDNKSLSSVTFDVNTNVIYIPRAFCNLTIAEPTGSLHDIVIPNSVRNIGDRAFSEGCLRSVVIGNSVSSIAYKAFSSNSNLSSITSYSKTAPDLGSLVFDGISSSGTLYVPSSSISSYTNNWLPALPSGWTISTI